MTTREDIGEAQENKVHLLTGLEGSSLLATQSHAEDQSNGKAGGRASSSLGGKGRQYRVNCLELASLINFGGLYTIAVVFYCLTLGLE